MGENLKTFNAGLTPVIRVNRRGEGHDRGKQQDQQENPQQGNPQQGKKRRKNIKLDSFVSRPQPNPPISAEEQAKENEKWDFIKLFKGQHEE